MPHCYNYVRKKAFGMKKAATWGTPLEPTTGDGIFTNSATLPDGNKYMEDNEDESARGMATEAFQGCYEPQKLTVGGRAYYEGIEKLIAFVMGAMAVTGTDPYTKTYSFLTCISALFATLAYDEETEVKSLDSAVLNALEFTISNQGLMWKADFIGNAVTEQSGWVVPSAVTYESSGKQNFKMKELVLRINDESGIALASGDEVKIKDMTLRIQRGFVDGDPDSGAAYHPEFMEENAPVITLSVTCKTKDSTNRAFFVDFAANTRKKADLVFTGAVLTPANYSLSFFLPSLYLSQAPNYDFASPTPVKMDFKAMDTAANPLGMDDTTPYIEVFNSLNTDYLA